MNVIDKTSRRWTVAVHEAGHKVTAEHLGWTVRSVTITASGNSGVTEDRAPWLRERKRKAIENAVISWAGIETSLRESGGADVPGLEHDRADTIRHLRPIAQEVTPREVQARAREVVNSTWSQIQQAAERLYLTSLEHAPLTHWDYATDRYRTAEHEAGHVVIARSYGWQVDRAEVFTATTGGTWIPYMSRIRNGKNVSPEDYFNAAMIALAGPVMSERSEWWPTGCGTDLDDARTRLKAAGVSWSTGRSAARSLVNRHAPKILQVAEKLYRAGSI